MPEKLLVIYGDRDPGDDLIHKMNSRKDKYDISGKVHSSVGEREIHKLMRNYDGVIIWDLPSMERNRYLKYCFAHSIRCYVSPKISDIILMGSDRIHLFDTPLLMSRNMGLSIDQRAAKRVMDMVISGIGIVITSPIMLIIALAVKLYEQRTGILFSGASDCGRQILYDLQVPQYVRGFGEKWCPSGIQT